MEMILCVLGMFALPTGIPLLRIVNLSVALCTFLVSSSETQSPSIIHSCYVLSLFVPPEISPFRAGAQQQPILKSLVVCTS